MYKYETHCHTAEVSQCGRVEAKEAVAMHKAAGYDGIVITDHYYKGFFDALHQKCWDQKVADFLSGYRNALEEGKKIGLTVLPGMEIRFTDHNSDYLVYGANEEFLNNNPELYLMTIEQFKTIAEKNGLLVFQAHPFRVGMKPSENDCIDGIEVHNGNPRHNSNNPAAYEHAKQNGLKMLSGSDFHQPEDLARGGILTNCRIETNAQLLDILKSGRYEIIRDK